MIVWMASYPRSGNRLLAGAVKAMYGVRPRTVYPGPDRYDYARLGDTPGEVTFLKTHETGSHCDSRWPAIVLIRDCRAATARHAEYVSREEHDPRPIPKIMLELASSGEWPSFYRQWATRKAPFEVLEFEDMVRDLRGSVIKAVGNLGLDLTPGKDAVLPAVRSLDVVLRQHPAQLTAKALAALRATFASSPPPHSATA